MAKPGAEKRKREVEEFSAEVDPEAVNGVHDQPSKKARVEPNHTLFVRSLPPSATAESITDFFSQHFPVKHAVVVVDPKTKSSRGYGFVTFTDADDTVEAKEKLNNKLLDGRRLRLDIAEARQRDSVKEKSSSIISKAAEGKRQREEALADAQKPARLIIRNLPWSIKTSDQLTAIFKSYGKVKFADLPQSKGKLAGFGFVTLRGRKNAEKAMEAVNGKVIDGRTVAVDWAVNKQTWEEQKDVDADAGEEVQQKKGRKNKNLPDQDAAEDEAMTQEDADVANFMKNHMSNLEDEDEHSEHGDQDGSDEAEKAEWESDSDKSEAGPEDEAPKKLTDNSTTVFVRNLPFTTTDELLKEKFSEFGTIRYARIVMDRATDRPAGTGFVCFVHDEDFKACLKAAPRHTPTTTLGKQSVLQDETVDRDGRYTLDGRILQVTHAVSKEEATRLASDGVNARNSQDKDKRRLYLLTEGSIPHNSPQYKMLAPSEVKMREASTQQRKKLIQSNPSLHLSLTRLALRNIPRNITSKDLKALAREAVVGFAKDVKEGKRQALSKEETARGGQGDKDAEHRRKEKGKGVVRQAKIVFETKEGSKVAEDAGAGKSRGYGFIEYSSHRWALMGLRWLNGHALKTEAGATLRLIVEFAIENANVVQRRRALDEKARSQGKPTASSTIAPGKFIKSAKGKPFTKKEQEVKPGTGKKAVADAKLALGTQIMARKRFTRKQKAKARSAK